MSMSTEKARIALAEAMGWMSNIPGVWWPPGNKRCRKSRWRKSPPDPFTDANDDYAVLEWMRNTCPGGCFDDGYGDARPLWVAYLGHIMEGEDREDILDYGVYQIGDYARAALKVLDNE